MIDSASPGRPPLAGLRVLDLGWVMVGPFSSRYLVELGADVIKVESSSRIDPSRTLPPFLDGGRNPERSVPYHFVNTGKRSIDLDLRSPEGRDAVLRLAERADVVVESFTPGVVERLGLGYDELSARNSGIVMVSTSIAGRSPAGPERSGVGTVGSAMCGAMHMVGYPGRAPSGPFGPWTDAVAPRFIVPTLLAALRRREATGRGCHIEVSQAEAGMQFLLPALYDYLVNGVVAQPGGAVPDASRAPCGLYPCAGDDRWVAIDAAPGEQWTALVGVVGRALADDRFSVLLDRLRYRAELDAVLGEWTSRQDAQDVEDVLQAAGVPAHVVSTAADLHDDPHLRAEMLVRVSDPDLGEVDLTRPAFRLARSPRPPVTRGPWTGEHTAEVLAELDRR
ncbi:CoA transferase [Actinomadura sp. LD22]|uniref:CoA transferase n=1 Tax=Actinomadura physcomitrii TaxID=2650748 RepID=A0A6I4MCU9_9ACTN|nr:CoA transferase [Actinomadura physcomitrii]MWA01601.1 CoA transferase [Actinomadura physcomitrii]